jgi:hypothetical protein
MILNKNNFMIKEIPILNPLGVEYIDYWRDFKRKCVEGYWVGGVWCPGPLFFYLNAWHIKLNAKVTDKNKVVARPFFRELEWDKSYLYMEARGFSGFADDDEVSCYRPLANFDPEDGIILPPTCYNKRGQRKKYVHTRDYLKSTTKNLGKPLFENEAQNIIDLEARESGKSFLAAATIGHNFLFSGATDYDLYLAARQSGKPMASETLVGSIETKYSGDLLNKVQLGLEHLPGKTKFGKRAYPSPLDLVYSGSWHPGNNPIKAGHEMKVDGGWEKEGQGTLIHHRSFENELGGNGTRPNLAYLEEVGFQRNLTAVLKALRDCTTNSGVKFGTIWMMGTGGENDPVALQPVEQVYRDPETYDCLVFEDHWENKGKIGYFCPPYKADNEFLNHETGQIDEARALNKVLKRREKLAKAKDKDALSGEMQNKPILPSEIFLNAAGNVFPIPELKAQLNYLETSSDPTIKGTKGWLTVHPKTGGVDFEPDLNNVLKECGFPVKKGDHADGSIVIWEHPIAGAPFGLYVAGIDPYSQDRAENSTSLGSTFIMRRTSPGISAYPQIVAEYTGRPSTVDEYNENVMKLLIYYNAIALYENQIPNIRGHLERNNKLHHLAFTPVLLKANSGSSVKRIYGQHMNEFVKDDLEFMGRDWLKRKVDDTRMNVNFIFSIPLLKELIAYNRDINTDRAIAFMLMLCQDTEMHRIVAKVREQKKVDNFFLKKFFT